MTDKELLQAAAKAAGIDLAWSSNEDQSPRNREGWNVWNPLTDDGDALRLGLKLRMSIGLYEHTNEVRVYCHGAPEVITEMASFTSDDELAAATRRAITRAAAALSELGAEHFGAEGK